MKSADIHVLTGLSDTLPDPSDSNYQAAALCLMLRKTLEDLDTADFNFNAVETTDFSTFNTDMQDFIANANTRLDELLQDGVTSVVANLPDVLAVGAAFASGGATEVGALILQMVLGHMFHREDSRAEAEGAHTDIELTDLIAKLEEIREQINVILTEFNINVYNDPQGQSWSVGLVD